MQIPQIIRKTKWVLLIIAAQCAVMVVLFIYSGKLYMQGAELQTWTVNQVVQLQHIREKVYEGTPTAYTQVQPLAAQLSAQLEQAQAGNLDLVTGDELTLAIKSWQIPVTGLNELLLQITDDSGSNKLLELLNRAQEEAEKCKALAGRQVERLYSKASSFRFSAILLTILLGLTSMGTVLYIQLQRLKNEIEFAAALHKESARNQTLTRFMEAVAAGDYQVELAEINDAALTEKLSAIRDKLRTGAEEEARRNRAATGLAQMGEILRSTTHSSELYDRIIKFVVTFTKSNQGGLFLHRQEDEGSNSYLELVAAYAFERKKFITKKIDVGQGLAGQCFLEAEKIYLTKVPDDYIHITSGLGAANPACILLVPLKTDDRVMGVMELASFSVYDEYEIQLIEKFAESIASTLAAVQINENTRLLLERTQQQAEEMRAQEEEMRQNMEELAATQEELSRKEKEYIRRIQELEQQLQARTVAT